jgi:hypothetical protein
MASKNSERCGAPTKNNGSCSLPAESCPHESHAKYREQEPTSDDTEGARDNNGRAIPEQEWWESHAEMLKELGGLKPQEGRGMADVAAQTWAKRAEMDKREAMRELFGICPAEGCERGKNGFHADGCNKHPQDNAGDDGGESQDDDEITVTINGDEVTGTPEDIRQLKGL